MRSNIRFLAALALVFLAHQAFADVERVSTDGDVYVVSENENGFVLTSKYPKSRFVERGSASYFSDGADIFYFGRSCDTFHERLGTGTWGWANAGFGADFQNGFSIWFPRQDVPWEGGMECRE